MSNVMLIGRSEGVARRIRVGRIYSDEWVDAGPKEEVIVLE